MARYDVELLLNDIFKMFQAKLNDKIDEVNAEKAANGEAQDDFAIININDKAWYLNHIPASWNYKAFVVYGLAGIEANENQNDAFVEKVDLFFEVCIPDKGEKINESQIYKLLRYARCLKDVAIENFDTIRGYGKLQVASLTPTAIEIDGKRLKSSGVTVTASISSR